MSGTTTTTSEVAGGTVGTSSQAGTSATTTQAQTVSIQNTAAAVSNNLSTGSQTGAGGQSLSPSAQANVLSVMTTGGGEGASQVLGALESMGGGNGGDGGGETGLGAAFRQRLGFGSEPGAGGRIDFSRPRVPDNAAKELLEAVSGLLGTVASMEPEDIEVGPTQRLIHAVDEFNEFVDTVPIESLRNPPDEFLAIHAVLVSMVQAADVSAR